jgi:excisionase family DNA binding protein
MSETQSNCEQQLLTADQLAERWQVAPAHVYRLAREDRIPVVRLGRYYRFRLDAIQRFEEESSRG